MYFESEWKTLWILISWLHWKPVNLDIQCFKKNDKFGFSRTSVKPSVTCLATDVSLTADPGVASSIPAWSHTYVEIDREIISTVILFPSTESFKKGCQLHAKVCVQSTD